MISDPKTIRRFCDILSELSAEHGRSLLHLYPDSQAFTHKLSSGYAVSDGVGSFMTQIFGWGLADQPVSDDELDETLALYHPTEATPLIEINVSADPTLFSRLEERGYRLNHWLSTLGNRLERLDMSTPDNDPIHIRHASDDEEELWMHTLLLGHSGRDEGEIDEATLYMLRGAFHSPYVTPYLAEYDGTIAGAAELQTLGDVAVLSSASTLPRFRNRGIHKQLIQTRLKDSYASGVKTILQQCIPESVSETNAMKSGLIPLTIAAQMRHKSRS